MDIVTHAAMGAIIAHPLMASHPLTAAGFMLGSTLPDLDALSRVFGKRAFLSWHQTYTHSIPLIVVGSVLGSLALRPFGPEFQLAILAAGMGMALHSLLDFTNTFGVTLLFPLSRRRMCKEWVFLIDAFVIGLTVLTGVLLWGPWQLTSMAALVLVVAYIVVLACYWLLRIGLRCRAGSMCANDTLSLVPGAFWPWIFLGCRRSADTVRSFSINAITGKHKPLNTYPIHDDQYAAILESVPEYQTMRELTPAYHVIAEHVDGDRTIISCRDMRITNFNTRFGQLDLVLNAAGGVEEKTFHV